LGQLYENKYGYTCIRQTEADNMYNNGRTHMAGTNGARTDSFGDADGQSTVDQEMMKEREDGYEQMETTGVGTRERKEGLGGDRTMCDESMYGGMKDVWKDWENRGLIEEIQIGKAVDGLEVL
jgi:hypothetical protein